MKDRIDNLNFVRQIFGIHILLNWRKLDPGDKKDLNLLLGPKRSYIPSLHAIANANSYCPQLNGNSLLLKTSHISIIKFGAIELLLNWKFPPYWLVSTVTEGTIHATKQQGNHQARLSMNLVCYNADLPAKYARWAIVAHIYWNNQFFNKCV